MQSLSLYGCVDSTPVAQLLQGRMERRNYVDVIRCRRNEKESTSCGKYGWCQSILQYVEVSLLCSLPTTVCGIANSVV